MNNSEKIESSAVDLFLHFPDSLKQEWALFLRSPFFRVPEKIRRLGLYLVEKVRKDWEQKLTTTAIHKVCFPEADICSHQQVYDAFSQLRKYLHQFLIFHQLRSNPNGGHALLIEGLSEIHAEKAVLRQTRLLRENRPDLIPDQEQALTTMLISHQATLSFARMQLREQDKSLELVIRDTDRYYLLSRIKYSCEQLNRQKILPEGQQHPALQEPVIGLHLWPSDMMDEPLIRMYLMVWDMLKEETDAAFYSLRKLLRTYVSQIGEEEAIGLYAYAQNFCIQKINTGTPAFLEELFTLYQESLEEGLLTQSGEIDHRQYKNIATVAFRLSRYEWALEFLMTYKTFLPQRYRDNAFRMNMASLHYEEGRYRQALQLLQQLEFTDVYYQLSARVLTLKIFFEKEDDESLDHLITTFRMFLQRNKEISRYQRQIHLNLVKSTRKLSQIRTRSYRLSPDAYRQQLSELIEKSTQRGNITNLSWLLAQARLMMQSVKPE